MSADSVDDMEAAEDMAGAFAAALGAILAADDDESGNSWGAAMDNARKQVADYANYCRPSCGWLTEYDCLSGGDENGCGCPCGHPGSRERTLTQYVDNYVDVNNTNPADKLAEILTAKPLDRYLLIEENARGGYWLTVFDSPERASEYHFNQEYASEWNIECLVDLDTGVEYSAGTVRVNVDWVDGRLR